MKKMFLTPLEEVHDLSGMIKPALINLILNSDDEDMKMWHSKWMNQIVSLLHSLKNKLTMSDSGKR